MTSGYEEAKAQRNVLEKLGSLIPGLLALATSMNQAPAARQEGNAIDGTIETASPCDPPASL